MNKEKKLPTAAEILYPNFAGLQEAINDDDIFLHYRDVMEECMKDFAEQHVIAAIKTIVNHYEEEGKMNQADLPYLQACYPLTNIK